MRVVLFVSLQVHRHARPLLVGDRQLFLICGMDHRRDHWWCFWCSSWGGVLGRWIRERRPFWRLFHPKCVTGNKMENVNTTSRGMEHSRAAQSGPKLLPLRSHLAQATLPPLPLQHQRADSHAGYPLSLFNSYYFCPQGKDPSSWKSLKRCHFGERPRK